MNPTGSSPEKRYADSYIDKLDRIIVNTNKIAERIKDYDETLAEINKILDTRVFCVDQ